MSKCKTFSRGLQEAVDKLLQHTLTGKAMIIGAVIKTPCFISVSGKKLLLTFAKKSLSLKGKQSGAESWGCAPRMALKKVVVEFYLGQKYGTNFKGTYLCFARF